MAVTKIIPVKTTIQKSVKYICNQHKTDDGLLIDSFCCAPETAAMEFELLLSQITLRNNAPIAFHVIQSFKPEEISAEKAHELGIKFADKLLDGKYSYVIATHINRKHIHNHILFCAADNEDHKKYHDCWQTKRRMRNISDEFCDEYGLSVIKENQKDVPTRKYKEWSEDRKGISWKSKVKADIDASLISAANYDDFIQIMKSRGYQIKGETIGDSSVKYISFIPEGIGRAVRGKASTLGAAYTKEKIAERIENKDIEKAMWRTKNLETADSRVGNIIETSESRLTNNSGIAAWTGNQNLKTFAKSYAMLQAAGIDTVEELDAKISHVYEESIHIRIEAVATEKELKELSEVIKYARQYQKYAGINKKYRNASNKKAVRSKYDLQLTSYEAARTFLEQHGYKPYLIDIHALEEQILTKNEDRDRLIKAMKSKEKSYCNLKKLQENINRYIEQDHAQEMKNETRN